MDLMVPTLVGAAVLGVVAGWLYVRSRRSAAPSGPFLYARCPGCDQRMRFLSRLAGQQSTCPSCSKTFTLPTTSQIPAEDVEGRVRVRRAVASRNGAAVARSA